MVVGWIEWEDRWGVGRRMGKKTVGGGGLMVGG